MTLPMQRVDAAVQHQSQQAYYRVLGLVDSGVEHAINAMYAEGKGTKKRRTYARVEPVTSRPPSP
jgi:hypothetical protein